MQIGARRLLSAVVFVTLSIALPLFAVEKGQSYDQGAVKELERLEDEWGVAVAANDADRIARFFTDDFLFVGAGGILQDRRQHLDDFRSGRLKVTSLRIESKTTHVYGDAGVVSSRVAVTGKFGDRVIDGTYQFTDTWVKQGGRWLAAARQQTQIRTPPPSPAGQ